MRRVNFILATILVIINFYFIPLTFVILKENGGSMGFGLYLVPISFFINLLLIPAFYSFKDKYRGSKLLFAINVIGVFFSLSLFWLFITTTSLD